MALLFEHLPKVISLFTADGTSAGEVHLPEAARSLSFVKNELLALLSSGSVLRRSTEGTTSWHAAPAQAQLPREYHSACGDKGLLRLALRQKAPEVEVGCFASSLKASL